MLYFKLKDLSAKALDRTDVWGQSFRWLNSLSQDSPLGTVTIDDEIGLKATVMRYDTKELSDCRFETHRKYIDIQHTIAGGEGIIVRHASELEKDGSYDEEKDLQFYQPAESPLLVPKTAGWCSVYYPEDAHRPQINDGEHRDVFKAVVKVPVEFLTTPFSR